MPAQTPRGAPYPLPTEPVADGAAAIRFLAEWADVVARTIADVLLAGPAAVIDFTNIPPTYSHLLLVVDATETGAPANDVLYLRIHGDPGQAYSLQYITGSGVSVAAAEAPDTSGGLALGLVVGQGFGSGRGSTMIVVPNYAKADTRKNAFGLTFSNAGDTSNGQTVRLTGGVYRLPGAIARLTLAPGTGDFDAGSRATLYGL